MSPELETAIQRTTKLFKTRDRTEDWGRNIIEGSEGISNMTDWTLYYSFLSNPSEFDPNAKLDTIDLNEPIAPPPPEFDVVTRRNGTDINIEYRLKRKSVEDEKEQKSDE